MSLPKYEDLSFEQKAAIELRPDSNNLYLGVAGSGKTIVALFRLYVVYL